MKKYKLEKLVPGSLIDTSLRGKVIVPISAKLLKEPVLVECNNERMLITKGVKPLLYRKFPDKFGRDKMYTIAYFEFIPTKNER
jgi:hypothetical protein